jgi:hypothetical protein
LAAENFAFHGIGFAAKSALPLMVTLVTLAFAMMRRSHAVSLAAITRIYSKLSGSRLVALASAVYGPRLVRKLSAARLVRRCKLALNKASPNRWKLSGTEPVRLLVIEDEDRLSGILKSKLGDSGFTVASSVRRPMPALGSSLSTMMLQSSIWAYLMVMVLPC